MTCEELTVRLHDRKGEPLAIAEVHLDLSFYIEGRFRYSFSLGRTDADGVCRTTFQEIERQLEANRRLFLMDYNTPLTDCDTSVGIVAPTAGELIERESAGVKWWPEEPSRYVGTANNRVRCTEQKFEVQHGSGNAFKLVCEVEADHL
jgi:hypothetical protein